MDVRTERIETIQTTLIDYLASQVLFNRDRATVGATEQLFDGLLDSLDTLRLVVFIEEQFQVHVDDGEMSPENFATVARIAQYIARKRTR